MFMPSSITSICLSLFKECTSLQDLHFEEPSSITSIIKYSFNNCTSLKEILLPSSLKSKDKKAFKNCIALIKIEFQSSINNIGDDVFIGCRLLKQIIFNFPSSLSSIGNNNFKDLNCNIVLNRKSQNDFSVYDKTSNTLIISIPMAEIDKCNKENK